MAGDIRRQPANRNC